MLFLHWKVSQASQAELSLLALQTNYLLPLARLLLSVLSPLHMQPPSYLCKGGCIVQLKFRHSLFYCVSFHFTAEFLLAGANEKARFQLLILGRKISSDFASAAVSGNFFSQKKIFHWALNLILDKANELWIVLPSIAAAFEGYW